MVRLYVAGRVQIEGPDGRVTEHELPGRQGRLMLVRLALSRSPVTHEELADMFWPADRPESWRATLSPLASRIRAAIDSVGAHGKTVLVSRHGAYELVVPDRWVDVEVAIRALDRAESHTVKGRFRDAWPEAAVASAILRRPFLAGEDHHWAGMWRRTLTDGMVRALACLAEAWLDEERWSLAEHAAAEAIDIDPLREVGHRHRIRALAGAGNDARALRAYRELERLLAEELGAAPSAETERLYESLL